MQLTAQRTLALDAPPSKPPKRKPTAKCSLTDEELARVLPLADVLEACLLVGMCVTGNRVSAQLATKVDWVMDQAGQTRDYLTIPRQYLKGGKGTGIIAPKPPDHWEIAEGKCWCPGCKRYRGELPPIKRRPPDDRTTPIGAWKPYVERQLDALAARYHCTRAALYGRGLYLFASRKTRARTADPSTPKAISRQQAWLRLHQLYRRAGLDPYLHACHGARKTSAQWMLKASNHDITVVRDWLQHRNSATTDAYLRSDTRQRLALATQASHEHVPALMVAPTPPPAITAPKRRKRAA